MKSLGHCFVSGLLVALAGCGTFREQPIHPTEVDLDEPSAKACVVTVHVDKDRALGFVDQDPAYAKRCDSRSILFQVNGKYKFTGSGITFKPGSIGTPPVCKPEPPASKKKIKCTFGSASPARIPYELTVEPNAGVGVIKIDPMMIND